MPEISALVPAIEEATAHEAAASLFVLSEDEASGKRAREAMIRSVEAFEALGAVADVARVRRT